MKDELKVFENRSDDWLAKQRAYEDRHSAWDLDDAKYLKEEHHQIHRERDISKQNFKNIDRKSSYPKDSIDKKQSAIIKVIVIGTIAIFMIPFLIIFISGTIYFGGLIEAFPIIVFIIIMVIITIKY